MPAIETQSQAIGGEGDGESAVDCDWDWLAPP